MRKCFYLFLLGLCVAACASIGQPDGGMYDETPPKVVSSNPAMNATHITGKNISILFNEYIKLDRPNEKVMISPPQIESANVRAEGKRVKVTLYDTLQPNTTYTIDFGDAIEDNNEGNPMGFYTYAFSTGDVIDTMEIAGTVLNAEDLEPVKGIMVGVYPADSTYADSLIRTKPFARVSRTNGEGRFIIKGVRPGSYRILALEDKDGDLLFGQKNERVAFDTLVYTTTQGPDVRMDTVWRDSTHYDSINVVPYTHYYPDNIVLRAFLEEGQDQHLLKHERPTPDYFRLYFTAPADTLPIIKGKNFDESCLVAQPSLHNDTITYWVTDTTYAHLQDTLSFDLMFLETDSTGQLSPHIEELDLVSKQSYKKIREERQKQIDDWEKQRAKQIKRSKKPLPYEDNPYLREVLEVKAKPSGTLSPNQNITFSSEEPFAFVDTAHIHFYVKQDTNWVHEPYLFLPVKNDIASYRLYAEWEPKKQYKFEADSAAFVSVLGKVSKKLKQEFSVRSQDDFGSLFVNITSPDTGVVVQLLNRSGKVEAEQRADEKGRADFYYLRAGSYFLRCYIDANGNGKWDTGSYDEGRQPEDVYYLSKAIALRAQWDVEQDWNLTDEELTKQKPAVLTKQKADKKKTVKERNKERERMLKDPNYKPNQNSNRSSSRF